jgi:transcription-repair coupling factor (superfamily II helicase)
MATGGNKKIIVTYPEALMEKVADAKSLSSNIISIKVNDRLDTNILMERLVGYGFE